MLRVPFATIQITALAVGVRPAAAPAVDHELKPAAGLIRQCKPVTQQPLLLDVFVDGALVDLHVRFLEGMFSETLSETKQWK